MRAVFRPIAGLSILGVILACGGGPPAGGDASPPATAPTSAAARPTGGSATEPATEDETAGDGAASGPVVQLHPTLLGDRRYPDESPYPAWKAFDGKLGSTWVVGEAPLLIYVPEGRVSRLELVPGFALDARRWAKNRRPTKIRVRQHANAPRRESAPGPWQTFELSPPDTLPEDPWVSLDLEPLDAPTAVVEVQVLDATPAPPGGDDDICISEVRVFGTPAEAQQPKGAWLYSSTYPWVDPIRDFSDHLDATFDRVDLVDCDATHDGTGGGNVLQWDGTCERVDGGIHLKGRRLSPCFGQTERSPYMEWCDPEEFEPFDRVLPMVEVGPCFALIEGHPFRREGC